jgi:predicted RNase H-like HicB family nuclease
MKGGFRMHQRSSLSSGANLRSFEVEVACAEEGVWTATSKAIPGLNIEGETFEEAIAEARIWAPELLRANGVVADSEAVELVFSREGKRLAIV